MVSDCSPARFTGVPAPRTVDSAMYARWAAYAMKVPVEAAGSVDADDRSLDTIALCGGQPAHEVVGHRGIDDPLDLYDIDGAARGGLRSGCRGDRENREHQRHQCRGTPVASARIPEHFTHRNCAGRLGRTHRLRLA